MNMNLHNLDDSLNREESINTQDLTDSDEWLKLYEETEEERLLAEIYVDPIDLQMLDTEID